jgi:Leucine-rich repeat (LRR) protein
MVQVTKRNAKCGTIKRCRVHDVLRELAISESKEQKFVQVNPKQNDGHIHTASRRATYFQTETVKIHKNNNLRSLLIFDVPTPNQIWFRLLRLLELRNVGTIENLPTEVANMVHLRYLGLRGSSVCSLPEKIDSLQKLQTLDIRGTPLTSVPVSLWDITTLRHVHTDWFRAINGPPKGSKLESIMTLKYVKVMAWEDGLPELRNIRKLGIVNKDSLDSKPTARLLKKMEHLRNLTIGFGNLPEEIVDMRPFRRYKNIQYLSLAGQWPRSMPLDARMLPVHITQLVLYNTRFEQDPMPELKKLKSIKVLYLIYNAMICKMIACSPGGFLQLEKLCLLNHNSLEEWFVEEGSLPVLKHLYIQECLELRMLPDLHHVTTLQELEMRSMRQEFVSRIAQPGGEDWHKIKHIPSIQY